MWRCSPPGANGRTDSSGKLRTLNAERPTPNEEAASADEVLSKGPAVAAVTAPNVSLADKDRAKLEPEQDAGGDVDRCFGSETTRRRQVEHCADERIFIEAAPGSAEAVAEQAKPDVPVPAAPAAAARDQSHLASAASAARAQDSARGAKQQFAQRAAGQAFRNNLQITRTANVLNNFQVEQQGSDIRIVDADGSTYTGKFEPISETANRAVAKLKENNRSRAEAQSSNLTQQARFRATGFNVSLKRSLVFEGDYVASPPQAEPLKAEKRADMAPQQQEAARIVGRATVHGETPVEVDAVAVAGPTPAER